MDNNLSRLKQYQEAVDSTNIVSKTNIKGIITFVNDEFCNISKYSRDELLGQPHNVVRHPDVSPHLFEILWSTILAKNVYKGIVKNRAKDGTAFYLNTTIIPILDKNGDIEEFVALRYDITEVINLNERLTETKNALKELNLSLEKKVAEQTNELKELNRGLEARITEEVKKNEEKNRLLAQQAKLASMGEMIGNIAHQWRQPLSELGIDLFKMKQNFNNEKSFTDIYEHAKKVIKNMSNTIDDFRNFFHSDKENSYFSVKEVSEETLQMLKSTIDKEGIKVDIFVSESIKIYGIKSEFFQVLMNLLTNAKDALDGKDDKYIRIEAKEDDKFTYVSVFNIGDRIDRDMLDKIFEPYFTTKHKSTGTGLGLYINRMIIENLKGSIDAKNSNGGVEFEIKIPKMEEI